MCRSKIFTQIVLLFEEQYGDILGDFMFGNQSVGMVKFVTWKQVDNFLHNSGKKSNADIIYLICTGILKNIIFYK